MNSRFELHSDDMGRVAYRLMDGSGDLLLQGLPSAGRVAAQAEVMHVRSALSGEERVVPHQNADGRHFVVVKDKNGEVLGKSRLVDAEEQLPDLVAAILDMGRRAPIIDCSRKAARKAV